MSDGHAPAPRSRGAQPRNANARKHGVHALARRLKGAGPARMDGRSVIERARRDWMAEIREARGGDLSPQQEALLVVASATWVMLGTADAYILEHGVINRRRGTLRPIVEQRAKLARTLRELLTDIGLKRARPPKPSLNAPTSSAVRGSAPRRRRCTTTRVSPAVRPMADRRAGVAARAFREAMGTPGLIGRGRSVPRIFRRDSGNSTGGRNRRNEGRT